MTDGPVAQCRHVWLANSGAGGNPDFRPNTQLSRDPVMHVKCRTCGQRTWFTEAQWSALSAGRKA